MAPVDKAGSINVFIKQENDINCILAEIGFNSAKGNHTYTHKSLFKEENLKNQNKISFLFPTIIMKVNYLTYIRYLKLHKNPLNIKIKSVFQ